MPIIEVKNLIKSYAYHKKQPGLKAAFKALFKREKHYAEAVRDISFKIEEGELVGFLGPNGAGKTTTLKMLSGILHPSSGEAKVMGYVPWDRKKEFQKQFSLVMGQKNQLWWDLPPIESFLLNKEIYEVDEKIFNETLEELVELLDVKDVINIQVRKLSLGQRMKCELIAALLHQPKVIFLDEPTIGLDVVAQKNIRDFIKKYNQKNKTTIILTSHYMEDIKELCDRVILIDNGLIIYDGNLDSLIKKYAPQKELKIIFDEKVDRGRLEKFGEISAFDGFSVSFKIDRKKIKEKAAEVLTSDLPVDDILINEVEIDRVIRRIFGNAKK
jgi:ABC-2 type transport system ATP-binding protein